MDPDPKRGYWKKVSLGKVRGYSVLLGSSKNKDFTKQKLLRWLEEDVLGKKLSWRSEGSEEDLCYRIAICEKTRNGKTYLKVLFQLNHYPVHESNPCICVVDVHKGIVKHKIYNEEKGRFLLGTGIDNYYVLPESLKETKKYVLNTEQRKALEKIIYEFK